MSSQEPTRLSVLQGGARAFRRDPLYLLGYGLAILVLVLLLAIVILFLAWLAATLGRATF